MTVELSPARARAARMAVSVLFFANGAISASVLPRLPAIKDSLGLSNSELGLAVAAAPIGGLLMGVFAGALIARFGSGRVATVAGTVTAGLLLGVGFAGSWAVLAAAFLVMGAFDATMDAAMNSHGIGVQRRYGRSILQGFHGMWSVGSMVAGAIGAVAAGLAVPVSVHLGLAGLAMAFAILATARAMLPAAIADVHPAHEAALEPVTLRHAPRLLRILAPIAMLGILCVILQGSAATWSAVYLAEVLLQPQGLAALAYVVYMAAMVLGRLTNDRWVDRWGERRIVRIGALIGGAGVLAVIASGPLAQPLLAFGGFAAVGLGTSPMFPVMVGVAGSRPGIPAGHGVALAAWMVRFGLVFAPAAVGLAADAFGLGAAFVIPLAAAVVIALAAGPLTGGPLGRRANRVPAGG
ncbi:MAG TPA: MFS transporter [Candidatus Limnocylindrales bacterium]|nr:MFS transporter [Candidatus Limnocylindrales bacterium]